MVGLGTMMDSTLRDEIDRLHAQICAGLADPNRILILYALAEQPHNVTELAVSLDMPQPTTSRHLKILRDRGMVTSRRDGKAVVYTLGDARIMQALNLLRAVLADVLKDRSVLADQF